MAVILKFRDMKTSRGKSKVKGPDAASSGGNMSGSSADVVIFPGIRVDYGPVEAALGQSQGPSEEQRPKQTGPSGRRSSKRRKA
jgi:hypothetical protein